MQIDLRVLELLSSKICHDLISPVSAINNGVELIEDIGESVVGEAMKLIADSAAQSARRLKMFRMAYGRAGSEESLPFRDVRAVVEQYFSVGKVSLNWPENLDLQELTDWRGSLKTLINIIILAEELLPYGGTIALQRLSSDDTIGCRLEIAGKAVHISAAFQEALDGLTPVDNLNPRTIQSYITGRFAAHFSLAVLASDPRDDRLEITLRPVPA